jgi:TatD-related deoxyribonuclease
VTKPSWSYGISPSKGEDYRQVFDETLAIARDIAGIGLVVFPVLGVHPAEISRLTERMPLADAADVMKGGLTLAARYVADGKAVAIKSGRPHYPTDPAVAAASNDILLHALALAKETGCALQIHAETGPCSDVTGMAARAGMPKERVVKHFGTPDTPLVPSLIAKHESIPLLAKSGRAFMMESDYMDENERPGAVIGPRSVPRFTRRLLDAGRITVDEAYRIHADTPSRVYGVRIGSGPVRPDSP